jgi:hypothetical protein
MHVYNLPPTFLYCQPGNRQIWIIARAWQRLTLAQPLFNLGYDPRVDRGPEIVSEHVHPCQNGDNLVRYAVELLHAHVLVSGKNVYSTCGKYALICHYPYYLTPPVNWC